MGIIKHYGTPRHSGRYPWGSGKDPQRSKSFGQQVKELKEQGLSEVDIAKGFDISTTELRKRVSIDRSAQRKEDAAFALKLKEKGLSNVAIAERMGRNESSIRALLDPILQERAELSEKIANVVRKNVDEKRFIDVGSGVETSLGISRTKLDVAVKLLQEEGYKVHYIKVEQMGAPGRYTSLKVLTPSNVDFVEVFKNRDKIKLITDHFEQGGRNVLGLEPPQNISSERVKIRYGEEGGLDRDGLIELRRGVPDISLGNARYAQVRIGVDGTHFMKGMAVYSDDIPSGFDVIYNSKKSKGTPKDKVFKPNEDDPDNPFGSIVRQRKYIDFDGKEKLSALNIVNEEGDWTNWKRSLSSQVLSKQPVFLAKKQLDLALGIKEEEFEELKSLTNPVVKKHLLKEFADGCDSAAVELKAAAMPRQRSHVLIPILGMKPKEVYAPNFDNGENVVLIRHPHGGIFEIPELIVNNKVKAAKDIIGGADDAIGIHPLVAKKLSGADFDGDTVLVIPNKSGSIKTSPSLKALKDFDPHETYKISTGIPTMTKRGTQVEMGKITNLITDMTIKGANQDEIARAVKHSMVVIDARKHALDYQKSAIDNGIAQLKKKYQGSERAGSSTLISRAASEERVPLRKPDYTIGKDGKKVYQYLTGEYYTDSRGRKRQVTVSTPEEAKAAGGVKFLNKKTGKLVTRTTKTTKMAETDDAYKLSSGTRMETIYAEHANNLKQLANKSRRYILETGNLVYSPSARETYAREVSSLHAQLNLAIRNKPLERQAQLLANKVVAIKRRDNPDIEPEDLGKIKGEALTEARNRVGAGKIKIEITDREWQAIQSGAISNNVLTQILLNSDPDKLKERALPRSSTGTSPAKAARAKSMINIGYTKAEVASALGISLSTLENVLK